MMRDHLVLLVTNEQDFAADRVVHELDRRGVAFARLNTEKFPTEVRCHYEIGAAGRRAWLDLGHGRRMEMADVTAVWYRRPEPCRIDPAVTDVVARRFARRESMAALRGLLALASGARWINRPETNRAAEHRLVQLAAAAAEGLRTPATIVTNDPAEAARFHSAAPAGTVVKTLGPAFIHPADRRQVFTSRVRPDHLKFVSDVGFAPVLLQERIEKRLEIRATVIGDRILAAAIDSQSSPTTRDDWRRDVFEAPHRIYDLPDEVAAGCRRLTHRFGLAFSALDLILTPTGDHVFLDLNPNGEWDWVEAMTGLPIAAALADELCTPP